MTPGDTLTCTVETLAYGGDGLARVEGRVLFIPQTAPGETVTARVTQVKKNFARATLLNVVTPSPDRIEPCCRIPGCVYDHLAYPAEVQAKQRQLEGFLRRLPHAPQTALLPPLASPSPLHYRNKIVLHLQRDTHGASPRLGYRQEPSHHVLDLPACPLACDAINLALRDLRAASLPGWPDGTRVTFRHTAHDGALWWADAPGGHLPSTLLTEASPAGPLRVPPDGFYQVNPAVGDALVRTVAAWFTEDPAATEILDLYCGVGVFGLACLSAGGTRLTGVESGHAAVETARHNAQALGLPAIFLCRELGRAPLPLADLMPSPAATTVIIDPPRDGLPPQLARDLAACRAARLFYVSCDPATLARDLAILLGGGHYLLGRVRLFDMFPRTAHFETAVELTRAAAP